MKKFDNIYDAFMQEILADARKTVEAINIQLQAESLKEARPARNKFFTVASNSILGINGSPEIRVTA